MEKIKIGISSCLLGEKVRYDGGHKLDRYIAATLGRYMEWVAVCPEVEYGLPVPRESMHLVGEPEHPRLVTTRTGVDHTDGMLQWAEKKLRALEKDNLCGFIFKSRSPSSGLQGVTVYSPAGMPPSKTSKKGMGIFGGAFARHFPLVPVIDDGRLHDPRLRENFIERVFALRRWKQKGGRRRDLVDFHTGHKLIMLSHSPGHYATLGRMVAKAKEYSRAELDSAYLDAMMEGLRLLATPGKNANVLHHIMGHFKKNLSEDEKRELLEVIGAYRQGLVPLIVPVTLLKHFVRKYDEPYLQGQHYLNPHPLELMLRNHV